MAKTSTPHHHFFGAVPVSAAAARLISSWQRADLPAKALAPIAIGLGGKKGPVSALLLFTPDGRLSSATVIYSGKVGPTVKSISALRRLLFPRKVAR